VIGAVVTAYDIGAPRTVSGAFSLLTIEDFASPEHRMIWGAMSTLQARGAPIDETSVSLEMRRAGDQWPGVSTAAPKRYHGLGVVGYLAALSECSVANVDYHTGQLREMRGRAMAAELGQAIAAGSEGKDFAASIAERADALRELVAYGAGTSMQTPQEAVEAYWESHREDHAGLQYGWPSVDRRVEPMRPGDFIMIAGRPSMGKSVFAGNVARYNLEQGKRVAIFSLEMPTAQIEARWIAADQGIQLGRALRPADPEACERAALGAAKLRMLDFGICDISGLTVPQMESRIRQEHARKPFDLAVIDYLQLVSPTDPKAPREQQVAAMSKGLKVLARNLKIPVLCVCQLNRGPESRSGRDRRPMLSDFRESGSIEQDVDFALMLYREHYYDKEADPESAELLVRKQRNGDPCEIPLRFQGPFARFLESF